MKKDDLPESPDFVHECTSLRDRGDKTLMNIKIAILKNSKVSKDRRNWIIFLSIFFIIGFLGATLWEKSDQKMTYIDNEKIVPFKNVKIIRARRPAQNMIKKVKKKIEIRTPQVIKKKIEDQDIKQEVDYEAIRRYEMLVHPERFEGLEEELPLDEVPEDIYPEAVQDPNLKSLQNNDQEGPQDYL